jgi:two-component system OmpR family response regulator
MMDGLEALRRIRESGTGSHQSPAILITAELNGRKERLAGIMVADDYVNTDVGEIEIMARLVNCIERGSGGTTGSEVSNGPLVINRDEHRAYFFGEPLDLKGQGFDLLLAFCEAPGKPFTKEMLFHIAAPAFRGDALQTNYESLVFKAINRLREVLMPGSERLPSALRPVIDNLRGQGYIVRDLRKAAL